MDDDAVVYDYIVVGGGLSGSVVASRLRQYTGSSKILVVEAGQDTRSRTDILKTEVLSLGGELDWMYQTEPVPGLNSRDIVYNQGKGLGGSTLINGGGWTRGAVADYDDWAAAVGDERWSYKGQLPFMKKAEEWFDKSNPEQHGLDGPMYVASSASTGRKFPLTDAVAAAWDELGVRALPNADQNSGDNLGRAQTCEARRQGRRQFSAKEYSLDGVAVLTDTLVKKVVLERDAGSGSVRATGVELADGRVISSANVICSAGTFRSPQLLMLSGIGPSAHLREHGIEPVMDSAQVGQGLTDHVSFYQFWRLRDPSKGYTLGSANPLFQQPEFALGVPLDWMVCTDVPHDGLASAMARDEGGGGSAPDAARRHPYLRAPRSQVETILFYMKLPAPGVPMDAEHLTTITVPFLPTSRGSVTLRSPSPADAPRIDLNYLATEADRYVSREGVRTLARLMLDTAFGREHIRGESQLPPGLSPVTLDDDDAALDARLAATAATTWHASGSCAMGRVVDAEFRVRGVRGLRVVDASVLPVPLSAHIQAPLYAMSEQAAAMIAGVGAGAEGR